jgi:hypothetical protein
MMMQRLVLTLAIAFTPTMGFSDDSCREVDKVFREDGALLFSVDNSAYRPVKQFLNEALADGRPRNVWFTYVASDPSGARHGTIVIKTGTRVAAEDTSDKVTLKRTEGNSCNGGRAFEGGAVAGRLYDRYHDYSYSAGDEARVLDAFHTRYPGRNGCTASNDDSSDSFFRLRWQSNRSQFSFDPGVVERGQYSQFADQFVPTRALASGLRSRRVEMRRYAMKETPVCIEFRAELRPGTFVRVVDLERRIGFERASEEVWEWATR